MVLLLLKLLAALNSLRLRSGMAVLSVDTPSGYIIEQQEAIHVVRKKQINSHKLEGNIYLKNYSRPVVTVWTAPFPS